MKTSFVFLASVGLLLAGCPEKKAEAPKVEAKPAEVKPLEAKPVEAAPAAASAEDKAKAKEIWAGRCVPCHGPEGAGDGPASAGLSPKPRNMTDAEWHKTTTDAAIETVILKGGLGVGKSAAMPPNPDLEEQPGVVAGLREVVRGFKK